MSRVEKPLLWIGSSKKDLVALPTDVVRFFGHALDFAQHGDQHDAAKILRGFGGGGVLEIIESDVGGTYRAVYTVKFEPAVFVLHCFQKKSKSGIATPKKDMVCHSCAVEIGRSTGKGDGGWKIEWLTASRSKRALATSLPILAWRMPTS